MKTFIGEPEAANAHEEVNSPPPPAPRAAGRTGMRHAGAVGLIVLGCIVATLGTVAVTVAGFALSFDAIGAVGVAAGVNPDIAWMLPVSIDGAMTVATITAIMLRAVGRRVWYPWLVVVVGVAISILCNAAHAGLSAGALRLDADIARVVSAIPAVTLFLSVHLLITLALAVLVEPDGAEPAPDDRQRTADLTVSEPVNQVPVLAAVEPSNDGPDDTQIGGPVDGQNGASEPVTQTAKRAPRMAPATRQTTAAKVAKVAAKMPGASVAAVAKKTGVSESTARRHLAASNGGTAPTSTAAASPN